MKYRGNKKYNSHKGCDQLRYKNYAHNAVSKRGNLKLSPWRANGKTFTTKAKCHNVKNQKNILFLGNKITFTTNIACARKRGNI